MKARDVITTPVIAVRTAVPVENMPGPVRLGNGVRTVPAVNEDGRLVAVVTVRSADRPLGLRKGPPHDGGAAAATTPR